jgi:hypothetical protein
MVDGRGDWFLVVYPLFIFFWRGSRWAAKSEHLTPGGNSDGCSLLATYP